MCRIIIYNNLGYNFVYFFFLSINNTKYIAHISEIAVTHEANDSRQNYFGYKKAFTHTSYTLYVHRL